MTELAAQTFLLVENDNRIRKALAALLREMGHTEILQARTGTEAWSLFKQFQPDLIVSSWDLPEMNGLVLLKIIRADATGWAVPFILVMEEATKGRVIEAGEAGVTDLLLRPFTRETFRLKVLQVLEATPDPQDIAYHESYDRGLELMKQGRHEEALAEFKRILTLYESAEIYYNMGYIRTAQGRYEEAIVAFRRATQINGAFAQAYQKMGEVYALLGRQREAQECLEQAAEIFMQKHMDENAEAVLMQVLKINPNTTNVYNSLGILYRRQGKFGEAISQYRKALRVNPRDENILYNLARVFMTTKQFTEAGQYLKTALDINPDFLEARNALRSIEMGEGLT